MKVGDMVLVKGNFQVRNTPEATWPKCYARLGVIIELLHAASTLQLAKVMVLGEVDQFYLDELEMIGESR